MTIETKIAKNGVLILKENGKRSNRHDVERAIKFHFVAGSTISNDKGHTFTCEKVTWDFYTKEYFCSDEQGNQYHFGSPVDILYSVAYEDFVDSHFVKKQVEEVDAEEYAVTPAAMEIAINAEIEAANKEKIAAMQKEVADYIAKIDEQEKQDKVAAFEREIIEKGIIKGTAKVANVTNETDGSEDDADEELTVDVMPADDDDDDELIDEPIVGNEDADGKDSELVRLEAKVAQYQSDLDKADAQVKIACNEYDAVKANKNVSPDDLDDAGYNLVKADDRRTIINNLLCDAERNLAKYKVVGKIGTPNINPYSPNLRDELAAHVSKTAELIGDLRIKLHEEKDVDTRTTLELAIESLERNELSDATCWCVRFDRIGENFSGDERAALEAEFREELAKRFGIEKPEPPTDNEPVVDDGNFTFYDAQIHSYDDDFVSEQFDNPIDAYKWLEKKIKQSYALERGTRQIEFYGKHSYKVIYRYIPDCRELFIDDTLLENFITNRTPKFTYRTKRGKIRTLKIGETNWAENSEPDDDTSDDDFSAKLAKLETKFDRLYRHRHLLTKKEFEKLEKKLFSELNSLKRLQTIRKEVA